MTDSRRWCEDCQAEREAAHVHGDRLEALSRDELLALVRVLIANEHEQRRLQAGHA